MSSHITEWPEPEPDEIVELPHQVRVTYVESIERTCTVGFATEDEAETFAVAAQRRRVIGDGNLDTWKLYAALCDGETIDESILKFKVHGVRLEERG